VTVASCRSTVAIGLHMFWIPRRSEGPALPYQSYIDYESMRWRDANLLSRFIS